MVKLASVLIQKSFIVLNVAFIQFLVVPYFLLLKQIFLVCRTILANFKSILLQLEFKIYHRRYDNFSHSSRFCATSLANYAAMRGMKKSILGFPFLGRSINRRRKS